MKIWIHAATNPIEDSSIRRAFDRIWKEVGGDPESFYGTIDAGYGNSDLPRALTDVDNVLGLAEAYVQYKQSMADRRSKNHTFDIKGATATIQDLVSEYSGGSVVAEYDKQVSKKINRQIYLEVKYKIYVTDVPAQRSIISVNVHPDTPFTVDSGLEREVRQTVDRLISGSELVDEFMDNYSGLLDTFYGDYLDIPADEYQNHLRGEYFGSGSRGSIEFTWGTRWDIAEALFEKGFTDNKYVDTALMFLRPLFESYGLRLEAISLHFATNIGTR